MIIVMVQLYTTWKESEYFCIGCCWLVLCGNTIDKGKQKLIEALICNINFFFLMGAIQSIHLKCSMIAVYLEQGILIQKDDDGYTIPHHSGKNLSVIVSKMIVWCTNTLGVLKVQITITRLNLSMRIHLGKEAYRIGDKNT